MQNKPPHPNQPSSFLGGQSLQRAAAVPARLVEVPAKAPKNQHSKNSLLADRQAACLSVSQAKAPKEDERYRGPRVVLSKALLAALPHLGCESPVEIVPPLRRGGTWHLDTRITAPRRLHRRRSTSATFYSSHRIGPDHFLRSTGIGSPPVLLDTLYFRLGPQMPGQTGYYTLLPA